VVMSHPDLKKQPRSLCGEEEARNCSGSPRALVTPRRVDFRARVPKIKSRTLVLAGTRHLRLGRLCPNLIMSSRITSFHKLRSPSMLPSFRYMLDQQKAHGSHRAMDSVESLRSGNANACDKSRSESGLIASFSWFLCFLVV
jgi:hypothetical protein